MSNSIGNILLQRFKDYEKNPQAIEEAFKKKGKDYNLKYNKAVGFFRDRVNKDLDKPLPFMVYRNKLLALRELDDLKWLWYCCLKYSRTKDKDGNQNTFAKCFFGSLKIK